MAKQIMSNLSIAIHVRFFDAPDDNGTNNTPHAYYSRAVKQMRILVPGAHYYVFSDRPEAAQTCIPLPDDRVTYVSHNNGDENAYADLWLMSLCDNFIIANSTFSWWGAWLAQNKNKIIIAPGFEKRTGASSWGFDGLIPQNWIKL